MISFNYYFKFINISFYNKSPVSKSDGYGFTSGLFPNNNSKIITPNAHVSAIMVIS